jgi:hypothetical protein
VLNRVEPDDITAYVDLAGLGSGEYQLTGKADVSRDVGITRVEPAVVQVQITSAKN